MTKKRQEWELFKAFCLYYQTDKCLKPFAPMHDEWFKAVFENQGVILAAPRGFAKSHIFCLYLPLYLLLTKKNLTIALIGSSIKNVQSKWMVKLMEELDTNKDILRDFGEQKTAMWSRECLRLANGNQLTPYGVDTKYRGERPNWLIIDDIENDINVRNPEQRKYVRDTFESSWFNSLTPDGHLVVAGTILHPQGFISTLIHAPLGSRVKWFRKIYQGLLKDEQGNEVSAWPDWYPLENLLMRREVSPAKFEQEFQNHPIPDEMMLFHQNDIAFYNQLPNNLAYCTTVDPASSMDPDADESVILTAGADADGTIYVAEVTHGHFYPDEIAEHIFRHHQTWKSNPVGIETNGFQTLKWYIDTEIRKRHKAIPTQELKSGNSADGKHRRIMALQPYIKLGTIKFHKSQEPLVTQLVNYPGKHDDQVDALAYVLEILRPGQKASTQTYPKYSEGWVAQQFERKATRRRIQSKLRWHS